MPPPEPAASSGSGARPLLALAAITVVILVVMLVVLTRDTPDAGGPRTAAPTTSTAAPGDAGTSSTTTTTAAPKPGLIAQPHTLDDADEWTAPLLGSGQCAGPSLQDGVLAVMCSDRVLKGFDAVSGESLWSTKVDSSPADTFVDAPRTSGEHRFITADNTHIESVDAKTGEIVWTLTRDLGITSIETSGSLVVLIGSGKALAVDADTGTKRWEFSYPIDLFTAGGLRSDSSAADVLVASGTGIQATRLDTGESRWTKTMPDGPVQDLQTFDGVTYVLTEPGTLTALDATDGSTRWERATTFAGHFQSVIGAEGDRLFVVTSEQLVALNRADGSTLWTVTGADLGFPDGLNRTSLTGGVLVLLAPNHLMLVTPATGEVTVKRQMNLGSAGVIHTDRLLTLLEATGNSVAPGRLVTLDLK